MNKDYPKRMYNVVHKKNTLSNPRYLIEMKFEQESCQVVGKDNGKKPMETNRGIRITTEQALA